MRLLLPRLTASKDPAKGTDRLTRERRARRICPLSSSSYTALLVAVLAACWLHGNLALVLPRLSRAQSPIQRICAFPSPRATDADSILRSSETALWHLQLAPLERAQSESEAVHAVIALAAARTDTDNGDGALLSLADRARVPALVWALFRDGCAGGAAGLRSPLLLADCLWAVGTVRQPLPPPPVPPFTAAAPNKNRSSNARRVKSSNEMSSAGERWDVEGSPEYALAALVLHELCAARPAAAGRVAAKVGAPTRRRDRVVSTRRAALKTPHNPSRLSHPLTTLTSASPASHSCSFCFSLPLTTSQCLLLPLTTPPYPSLPLPTSHHPSLPHTTSHYLFVPRRWWAWHA